MNVQQFDAAIVDGNLPHVQALIQEHPELLDTRVGDDQTPMARAAQHGHLEMVDFLLQIRPEQVMTPNNRNSLPIHWAAERGHLPVVERLMMATPLQPNEELDAAIIRHLSIQNNTQRTPLLYAVCSEKWETVKFFLRRAPETYFDILNKTYKVGRILNLAIKILGWNRAISPLMSDFQTADFWHWFLKSTKVSLVQRLLEYPPIAEAISAFPRETFFRLLVESNRLELISQVITPDRILVPDAGGNLPLHVAAARGYDEIVCLLLDLTPLQAGESKNAAMYRHASTSNLAGEIPLDAAVARSQAAVVEILFRVAPETIFTSRRNVFSLGSGNVQLAITSMLKLFRLSVEEFGIDRILPLITNSSPILDANSSLQSRFVHAMSHPGTRIYSTFGLILQHGDIKLIQEYLAVDPDALLSIGSYGRTVITMASSNLKFLFQYGFHRHGETWVRDQILCLQNGDWIPDLLETNAVSKLCQIATGLRSIYGPSIDSRIEDKIGMDMLQIGSEFLIHLVTTEANRGKFPSIMEDIFYLVGGKVVRSLMGGKFLDTIFIEGSISMMEYILQLSCQPSLKVIRQWLNGTMTENQLQFLREVGLIPELSDDFLNQYLTPRMQEILKRPISVSNSLASRHRIWFQPSLTEMLIRWI